MGEGFRATRGVPAGTRALAWALVLLVAVLALALSALPVAPARATTTADAIDRVANGVFVQDGSGQDADALAAVVAEFADRERVVITVFAGGLAPTPEDRANEVLAALPADTVLLFTPDDVAVASDVHGSGEIDDAFASAGQAALDRDAAVASRALLLALTDEPTPVWVWLLLVLLVVGLALGIGRFLDARRTKQDEDRAFAGRQADLRSRLQTVAARILDLEGLVTLADDPAVTEDLANATAIYQDVQWALERVNRAAALEPLFPRLGEAEALLDEIAVKVG